MPLLRSRQSFRFTHKGFWGAFNRQQCILQLKKYQRTRHAFKNIQLPRENETATLLSYKQNGTTSIMCVRLARTCPDCFAIHSITRLKSCQDVKDTNNCPSRQLREMLLVPHFELCDRCYYQDLAVQEINCAVAKAMSTTVKRRTRGRS